jgi:UDP-N-acetylenolpyruvoylglucosamine reductase
MRIPGFEIVSDDINNTTIKIGAGEIGIRSFKRTVDMGLSGIETMSNIPGTAGASSGAKCRGISAKKLPILCKVLEAYDSRNRHFRNIAA